MAGGAVNPYLLLAGCIIAGMDGVRRQLPLSAPHSDEQTEKTEEDEGDEKSADCCLPTSLEKSLGCLLENDVFVGELPPEFVKCFVATRHVEIRSVEKARGELSNEDLFSWYRKNYSEYI